MAEFVTELRKGISGLDVLKLNRIQLEVTAGPDKGQTRVLEGGSIRVGKDSDNQWPLADPTISKHHLEISASERGVIVRDLGSTNGTYAAGMRITEVTLREAVELTLGDTKLRVSPGKDFVELPLSNNPTFGELVGQSDRMRYAFAMLERVSSSDATVLIEGESGTGKELAALGVHENSARAEKPFIIVDCGALPENLIESELFGHARGAFTGANTARRGAFDEANSGTVFLDEIGELPLTLQPRLLRFLERKEIKPIGENKHRKVDVRVIAATNRNLKAEAEAGRFREDLYYRLSVARVELPTLRDRPEDIELLARHCLEQKGYDPDVVLTREWLSLLRTYHWPGNVRELRNVMERLALMPETAAELLGGEPQQAPGASAGSSMAELLELPFSEARRIWQERFEKYYLSEHLRRADGVIAEAARLAGVPRPSFHRLMSRYGLRS